MKRHEVVESYALMDACVYVCLHLSRVSWVVCVSEDIPLQSL